MRILASEAVTCSTNTLQNRKRSVDYWSLIWVEL